MEWQFENTGHRTGVFNMEYDEALAQKLVNGEGQPTVRVYGWNPSAISLGWNQSMEEIDLAKTSAAGIDVVCRPTGGRAILHSNELTYSVTMRVKGKNILAVYDEISRALVAGLEHLGADVSIEKSQPHFPSLYKATSAVACFSSTGRYEIKWNGKKLVGSAQRRYATPDGEEVVLQHGSILLGSDHKRMVDFLRLPSESHRTALRDELDMKTTDLSAILQRPVSFEETVESLFYGFQTAWNIEAEQPLINLTSQKVLV
jgi:lipoyl(octanoyl) transferase